jgi:hypothetical protein
MCSGNEKNVTLFQYYAESHAIIYIVDSSDRDRIDESKETFGLWPLYKHFTCYLLLFR